MSNRLVCLKYIQTHTTAVQCSAWLWHVWMSTIGALCTHVLVPHSFDGCSIRTFIASRFEIPWAFTVCFVAIIVAVAAIVIANDSTIFFHFNTLLYTWYFYHFALNYWLFFLKFAVVKFLICWYALDLFFKTINKKSHLKFIWNWSNMKTLSIKRYAFI